MVDAYWNPDLERVGPAHSLSWHCSHQTGCLPLAPPDSIARTVEQLHEPNEDN